MTGKQLAHHLEQIDEKFLEEALEGLQAPLKKRTFRPRGLRILAAVLIIILALTATALAADWFGLRDLLLPQQVEVMPPITEENPEQTPYKADAISLAGYAGTPESLATVQWQTFLQDYLSTHDLSGLGNSVFAPDTAYNNYQVYTQEMADALDEITAAHGLKLHTDVLLALDAAGLCAQVGGDFLGENRGGGYIYEDGTFLFEGTLEIPEYGKLDYQLQRCVKGTFTDILLVIKDVDKWQEWSYVTNGGTAVTLALSANRGLLLLDLEDSFVTINVLSGTEGDDIFSSGPIGPAEIEALADSMDFSLLTPALPASF